MRQACGVDGVNAGKGATEQPVINSRDSVHNVRPERDLLRGLIGVTQEISERRDSTHSVRSVLLGNCITVSWRLVAAVVNFDL